MTIRPLTLIAALTTAALASADAQSLAERVASTRDGAVSFTFAARRGVCGDGDTFIQMGHSYFGRVSSNMRLRHCEDGPVQVRVTMRDGETDRIETWVGQVRPRDARSLGSVPAAEASRWLLSVASRSNGAASKAILPAVLADSATVWPELLTIARNTSGRSRNTRQEASFWLSRFAAAAAAGHRNDISDDDDDRDEKEDVKGHAVFVLSQLPHGGGTESLLDVARTTKDPHVRGKAMFWLGQSADPRAIDLFESVLR